VQNLVINFTDMEYMIQDPAFRAFVLMAIRRPLALQGDDAGEPPAIAAPHDAGQQAQPAITWQEPLAITWQGGQETVPTPPRDQTSPPQGATPYMGANPYVVGRGSMRGRRGPPPQIGRAFDLWSRPEATIQDVMAPQPMAKPMMMDVATNTDPLGVEEEEVEPAEQEEPTPEIYPGWKEALVLAVKEIIPRKGSDGRKFQEVYIGKVVQPPGGGEPYLVSAHVNINYNPNAKVTSWARILEGLIRAQRFSFTRDRLGSAVPFSTRCLKAGAGQRLIISLRPLRQAAGI